MRGFTQYTRLSEARKTILSLACLLDSETISFKDALDRVLAEDVIAKVNVPPFDRSAVDGYATMAPDTFGASPQKPVNLRVVGSITIGFPTKLGIKRGEAIKIMTGAMMPKGADSVVMVENTKTTGNKLRVFAALPPDKNVSKMGEDVRTGDIILKRGQVLRPQDIGMLASTGNINIKVFRRPAVAIIATGGELREPGERLAPAKITNSNSYSIAAAVMKCGGVPKILSIVPDISIQIRSALKKASENDMILVTGGSSVGERDLVPDAIESEGKLLFHGVAIRPGGPTAFGTIREKPVFALAGFPVATLVAFNMLARPAILQMQGLPPDHGRLYVRAKLTRKVSSTLGRADVVRIKVRKERGRTFADPVATTGSSILSSMTTADGFIVVPEEVEGLEKGLQVKVELY